MKLNWACHTLALTLSAEVMVLAQRTEQSTYPIFEKPTQSRTAEVPAAQKLRPFKPIVLSSPSGDYSVRTAEHGRIKYRRNDSRGKEWTFYACQPTALAFSGDGAILASAGLGKLCGDREEITIKLWDLKGRTPMAEFTVPGKPPNAVAVSADRVVIHSDARLHCFLVATRKQEWSIATQGDLCELRFSADANRIIASFADGRTEFYSAKPGANGDQ